jgi:hypothetical protein
MAVRRRDLSERPRLYTAQDVARFCEVDLKTVHHWADAGKVPCSRTEGRHLRFRRNDIVRFLRAHRYPLPDELGEVKPRVAVALPGVPMADELTKKLAARFALLRHASAVIALAHVLSEEPDALVLTLDDETMAGAASLSALKGSPATSWVTLAVLGADDRLPEARAAGVEVALPLRDASKLASELAKALAV